MDETEFWRLIGRLDWRQDADDRIVEPVVIELAKRPRQDCEAFQEFLALKLYAIDGRAWAREMGYGWWGGENPVGVDEFLYARCAVVANGRAFYEQVLGDPTAMPKDLEFEGLLYIASTAWERKTGDEDEDFDASVSFETYSNAEGWPPADPEPIVVRPPVARRPADDSIPTIRLETGREAVRRVIRQLVKGDLRDPVLSAYLVRTGQVVVMTPGNGVAAPPDDRRYRNDWQPGDEWLARIKLWAGPVDDPSARQPTGFVAVIGLKRSGPERVEGTLLRVEPQ